MWQKLRRGRKRVQRGPSSLSRLSLQRLHWSPSSLGKILCSRLSKGLERKHPKQDPLQVPQQEMFPLEPKQDKLPGVTPEREPKSLVAWAWPL